MPIRSVYTAPPRSPLPQGGPGRPAARGFRPGNVQAGGKPRDRIAGLRVTATDLDWTRGDGPEVTGPTEAILLAAAGRAVTLEELSGPGVAVLATGMER
jgi:hypothetical protein